MLVDAVVASLDLPIKVLSLGVGNGGSALSDEGFDRVTNFTISFVQRLSGLAPDAQRSNNRSRLPLLRCGATPSLSGRWLGHQGTPPERASARLHDAFRNRAAIDHTNAEAEDGSTRHRRRALMQD